MNRYGLSALMFIFAVCAAAGIQICRAGEGSLLQPGTQPDVPEGKPAVAAQVVDSLNMEILRPDFNGERAPDIFPDSAIPADVASRIAGMPYLTVPMEFSGVTSTKVLRRPMPPRPGVSEIGAVVPMGINPRYYRSGSSNSGNASDIKRPRKYEPLNYVERGRQSWYPFTFSKE